MKRWILVISTIICFGMTLVACQSKEEAKENTVEELLAFKDSSIGDASAVVNMSYLLPGGEYVKQVSLQTEKQPYEIKLDYGIKEGTNIKEEVFEKYWKEEVTKRAFLNNATTLFILVKNVDVVEFKLHTASPKTFKVTRKDIEDFYGKDVRQYSENAEAWEEEILQSTIGENEEVEKFFKKHPIEA
ncbi:MAG: DUF4825 domain-containing protein [Bacillus sp. (in: firmicutes)]